MERVWVYMAKDGEVSLWKCGPHRWFRYLHQTPKPYAKAMEAVTGKRDDGPCFWGSDSPKKAGLKCLGELRPRKEKRGL